MIVDQLSQPSFSAIRLAVLLNERALSDEFDNNFEAEAFGSLSSALKCLLFEIHRRQREENENPATRKSAEESSEPRASTTSIHKPKPRCCFALGSGNDKVFPGSPIIESATLGRSETEPKMIPSPIRLKLVSAADGMVICDGEGLGSFSSPADEEDALDLFSYGVVYNLALLLHSKALEQVESSSGGHRLLRKALRLYTRAYELLLLGKRDGSSSQTSSSCADSDWFDRCSHRIGGFTMMRLHAMVLRNNIGHIYHCLKEYQMANRWFDSLSSDVMVIVVNHHHHRQPENGDMEPSLQPFPFFMDVFLHNSVPFLLNQSECFFQNMDVPLDVSLEARGGMKKRQKREPESTERLLRKKRQKREPESTKRLRRSRNPWSYRTDFSASSIQPAAAA